MYSTFLLQTYEKQILHAQLLLTLFQIIDLQVIFLEKGFTQLLQKAITVYKIHWGCHFTIKKHNFKTLPANIARQELTQKTQNQQKRVFSWSPSYFFQKDLHPSPYLFCPIFDLSLITLSQQHPPFLQKRHSF